MTLGVFAQRAIDFAGRGLSSALMMRLVSSSSFGFSM
jgi:hypothetical protein